MNVTNVEIRPNSNPAMPQVLAFAKIELDGEFVIPETRLIQNDRGVFVSMPSKRLDSGWVETCYPYKSRLREHINQTVFAEYERVMKAKAVAR